MKLQNNDSQPRRSNYDAWRTDWANRFCTLEPQILLQKLPFLKIQDDHLIVPYLLHRYRISFRTGKIEVPEGAHSLTLMDEMNIYTLLWFCKPDAQLCGEFLPFSGLKNASPYAPAFQRGNLEPLAAVFSGHPELLREALLRLNGSPLPTGDVGYEVFPFPCFPVRVLFWDGDDEFPAQANLLFDKNATDFIHVESVVSIASELTSRLTELAGLGTSKT